jgi:D-serine deaminase-like pyridoxal phosphate-dependent protein
LPTGPSRRAVGPILPAAPQLDPRASVGENASVTDVDADRNGRPNVAAGDLSLPRLVLHAGALANNIEVMSDYARAHGFELAPHGKTTMAPALFRRQLDAGAWGMTVANASQARVAVDAGARRVLVANEVVSPSDVSCIGSLHASGQAEVYCLVDSTDGVQLLERHLASVDPAHPFPVLVELGLPGGRTGARGAPEAARVAAAVRSAARCRLAGVEGYEGGIAADRSAASLALVDAYLEQLRLLTRALVTGGCFDGAGEIIVSAGGSKYFDRVAAVLGPAADFGGAQVRLVVRSGCYLTHDHGLYARTSPLASAEVSSPAAAGRSPQHRPALQPALELWAAVLSAPEPGLAIVGLGRRDTSFDQGLPVPLRLVAREGRSSLPLDEATLFRLDDQHGYLRVGDGATERPLRPGDRIGFGISHPCTAFDRWREVLIVDGADRVIERVSTCFH